MELDRYLELLRSDSERIADVAASSDLDARVASCPEWTLGDLVYHVGAVHRFWTWVAGERIQRIESDDDVPARPQPDDADLVDWFRNGSDALLATIASPDPSTPVWSWTAQHDMAFIQRRMPQETAVHRWDAESALGGSSPIDEALAADGVDEFFLLVRDNHEPGDERVGLVATDSGDRWTAHVTADDIGIHKGMVDVSATLSGTASDLLLVLWRRLPLSALTVDGEAEVAERFLTRGDLN
jgi:uncharacterized protein (TIGR03083 family)